MSAPGQHDRGEDDEVLDLEAHDVLDVGGGPQDSDAASAIEGVQPLEFLEEVAPEGADAAASAPPPAELESVPVEDGQPEMADEADALDFDALEVADVAVPPMAGAPPVYSQRLDATVNWQPGTPAAEEDAVELADFLDDAVQASTPAEQELPGDGGIFTGPEAAQGADESEGSPQDSPEAEVADFITAISGDDRTLHSGSEQTEVLQSGPAEAGSARDEPPAADAAAAGDEALPIPDDSRQGQGQQAEFAVAPAAVAAGQAIAADEPAPAVQSSMLAARRPKKKSSLVPVLLITLLVLAVLGGGAAAGMYYAGWLTSKPLAPEVVALPPDQDPGQQRARLVGSHVSALSALLAQARPSAGAIDGAKLSEAQAYLDKLESDNPDLAGEVLEIRDFRTQLAALASQQAQAAEAERAAAFKNALDLAGADAPQSLDQGYLEEARRLAKTDNERNLIAALEASAADYQREQELAAAKAAEEALQKQAEMLTAIAQAVDSAGGYRAAVEAFTTAYPEHPIAAELPKAVQRDAAALEAVAALNSFIDQLGTHDVRKLKTAEATQLLADWEAVPAAARSLPEAKGVASFLPVLETISAREANQADADAAIAATFDNAIAKSAFVFATNDGKRYYMADKPAKAGDKFHLKYFTDLAGTTAEIDVLPSDADRAATGPATNAATAKAVRDALAARDEGWEQAFAKAITAVGSDARLDPLVKAQWLVVLARLGASGSDPIRQAAMMLAPVTETGIDGTFNAADPEGAAPMRAKCVEALAKAPAPLDVAKDIAARLRAIENFAPPKDRLRPAGILLRKRVDDAERWTAELRQGVAANAVLYLLELNSAEGPIDLVPVSEMLKENSANESFIDGRVLYIQGGDAPATSEPAPDTPVESPPEEANPRPSEVDPAPPVSDPIEPAPREPSIEPDLSVPGVEQSPSIIEPAPSE